MSGPVRSALVRLDVESRTARWVEVCGLYDTVTNITAQTVKIGYAGLEGSADDPRITNIVYAHEAWPVDQTRNSLSSGPSFTAVSGEGCNYLEVCGPCIFTRADGTFMSFGGLMQARIEERDGQHFRVVTETVLSLVLNQHESGRKSHWQQGALFWHEPRNVSQRPPNPSPRQQPQQHSKVTSSRAHRVIRQNRVPVTPRIGPSRA